MDECIVTDDVLIGWMLCVVVRGIDNDLQGSEESDVDRCTGHG